MSEGVVPLRRRGEEQSALDRFDVAAVEILVSGQAANLQTARAQVIFADLRAQRDEMTTVLTDVRSREPTGDPQIDDSNANLITAINSGIVQIDLFIARGRVLLAEAAQWEPNQSEASE
jgi:hypothetical protein